MNQIELAQELSERTGLARSICAAIVGEIFAVIETAAQGGNPVVLPGFGIFRATQAGGPLAFEPELKSTARSATTHKAELAFTQVTETKAINLQSKRMSALKMVEEAHRAKALIDDAEETLEVSADSAQTSSRRSHTSTARIVIDPPMPAQHQTSSDRLTPLATDLLGLDKDDLERGLGLAEGHQPSTLGRHVVFPVQVSRQAKDASEKRYRPTNGDERRNYKDLALKNFFVSLGSVVRDKQTHEPLLVYDVDDTPTPEGEKYLIKLLRVQVRQAKRTFNAATASRPDNPQEFQFESVDFNCAQHDVLMVIDPVLGPRIHGFDIGTFRDNDRRERAEICLAQEFEKWRSAQVD